MEREAQNCLNFVKFSQVSSNSGTEQQNLDKISANLGKFLGPNSANETESVSQNQKFQSLKNLEVSKETKISQNEENHEDSAVGELYRMAENNDCFWISGEVEWESGQVASSHWLEELKKLNFVLESDIFGQIFSFLSKKIISLYRNESVHCKELFTEMKTELKNFPKLMKAETETKNEEIEGKSSSNLPKDLTFVPESTSESVLESFGLDQNLPTEVPESTILIREVRYLWDAMIALRIPPNEDARLATFSAILAESSLEVSQKFLEFEIIPQIPKFWEVHSKPLILGLCRGKRLEGVEFLVGKLENLAIKCEEKSTLFGGEFSGRNSTAVQLMDLELYNAMIALYVRERAYQKATAVFWKLGDKADGTTYRMLVQM